LQTQFQRFLKDEVPCSHVTVSRISLGAWRSAGYSGGQPAQPQLIPKPRASSQLHHPFTSTILTMDLASLKEAAANLTLYDLKAGVRKVQNGRASPVLPAVIPLIEDIQP
jgi:hypothetical protein